MAPARKVNWRVPRPARSRATPRRRSSPRISFAAMAAMAPPASRPRRKRNSAPSQPCWMAQRKKKMAPARKIAAPAPAIQTTGDSSCRGRAAAAGGTGLGRAGAAGGAAACWRWRSQATWASRRATRSVSSCGPAWSCGRSAMMSPYGCVWDHAMVVRALSSHSRASPGSSADDAVPALGLGLVEGLVGPGQHPLQRVLGPFPGRQADAQGHPVIGGKARQGFLSDMFAEPLGQGAKALQIRLGSVGQELLAADAAQLVHLPQPEGHALRHDAEHLVPGGVAEAVVHGLEVVEVD